MVRAPCCEKMGLKKGPWTPEEDQILISYIQNHGHGNWRALPKHAGLLRCGKSCRLRWTNYLRPDIKRGNFSREEEDTIINLHKMLGNRWSAIAARLPGRTDNEIKNVWHTHLKKRLLKKSQPAPDSEIHRVAGPSSDSGASRSSESLSSNANAAHSGIESPVNPPTSPQQSSSYFSSVSEPSAATSNNGGAKEELMDSWDSFPVIDESFWSDAVADSDFPAVTHELELRCPFSLAETVEPVCGYRSSVDSDMDFWYNVFIRAGGSPEL